MAFVIPLKYKVVYHNNNYTICIIFFRTCIFIRYHVSVYVHFNN